MIKITSPGINCDDAEISKQGCKIIKSGVHDVAMCLDIAVH
jgi:hypothetical protein